MKKQHLLRSNDLNEFLDKLSKNLEDGYLIVPGTMKEYDEKDAENIVIKTYIAILEYDEARRYHVD